MRLTILILSLAFLTGCSLWPKRVEYFQDKVKPVPEESLAHQELRKEASLYVSKKTAQITIAAIKENASTNVIIPSLEANVVASSLSGSLGKPIAPWTKQGGELAAKLDYKDAKLDIALEEFKQDNNKNTGKAIEGTGLFSMGYFTQFIILFFIGGLVWIAIKVLSVLNPTIGIGSSIIAGGTRAVAKFTGKALKEVVEGGEEFKKKIENEFEDPETQEKIKELFRQSQVEKQSRDVQDAVKKLTNKPIDV